MYTIIEPLQKSINEVQDFILYKNYQPALDRLTEIVEHIPWDSTIREMRADAYLGAGNTMNAISEMRAMTKLTNDNTEGFFKLSTMHYQLGEGEESLQQVRECLKLDPEHKDCYPFYKKVKKVAKFITAAQTAQDSQDWEECITAANKVLKNEPKVNEFKSDISKFKSLKVSSTLHSHYVPFTDQSFLNILLIFQLIKDSSKVKIAELSFEWLRHDQKIEGLFSGC